MKKCQKFIQKTDFVFQIIYFSASFQRRLQYFYSFASIYFSSIFHNAVLSWWWIIRNSSFTLFYTFQSELDISILDSYRNYNIFRSTRQGCEKGDEVTLRQKIIIDLFFLKNSIIESHSKFSIISFCHILFRRSEHKKP